MYINRAKALLLVGTISAGCASANDDEGPDNPGAAGTAGAGGTSSAGRGGTGGGGGTGGTPSAGGGGAGGTSSTGGAGQGGGGAGGAPLGSPDAGGPDAGNPDAGDQSAPDAGGDGGTLTCDDTGELVVSCDDLDQTDCDGLESFLTSYCEMVEFIMKPVAGNAARNCMIALEPPELCDTTSTYSCFIEALAQSCPDADADDDCTIIAAACDDSPSFSTCSSTLSGMTPDGRQQMVTCATEACDLFACMEGLTY